VKRLRIVDGELAGTMGSFVFRWDLDGVAMPDRFFRMASAYLDAAIVLFRQMIEQGAGTYERALAANFMAEHAVELFFKGAVLQANRQITGTHDLDQLHGEFRNLYPGRRFEFTAAIGDFVAKHPKRPDSEYPRYPIDRTGKTWDVSEHFILEIWEKELTRFAADFERLMPLVTARYP